MATKNKQLQHVHCHHVGVPAIDGDDDREGVAARGECEYWEKAA